MKKIFITGASGCVGHYVFDQLVKNPDYHLYLLVRDPGKLMFNYNKFPNVTVIKGSMENIEEQAALLKEIDFVVYLAAGWDNTVPNFEGAARFFQLLDPNKLQKALYFSTASILDEHGVPVPCLATTDNPYIRSKYHFKINMHKLAIAEKIITIYPTWLLGGDKTHPYTHALQGILSMEKWLWLIRFFTVDVSFHFIHAYDLAQMVEYLLKNETNQKEMILGNKVMTAADLIDEVCKVFKKKVYFRLRISPKLVEFLFGRQLLEFDRYCLKKKYFQYNVTNVKNPKFPTITSIFSPCPG